MRANARFPGRLLRRLTFAAGWTAFVLVLLGLALEHSGLLADFARARLQVLAGGMRATLEGARLAWFDTRVDLVGVQLGEGEGAVRLEKVEVHWGIDTQAGFVVRELVVRGGRARITPELVQALEQRAGAQPGTAGRDMPPLVVRDVKLEALSERWGRSILLGSLDLRARGLNGGVQGEGALHRPLGEIYLHGALEADRKLALEMLATGVPVSQSYLPEGELLDATRDYEPRGMLALEGHVDADLRPEGHATGSLRLSLSQGSLKIAGGTQDIEHLALDFDGHVEAADIGKALDPGAWECALKASGTWIGRTFEGWAFLGPALAAGARARGFVHLPSLPLDGSIVDLLAEEPGERARIESRWNAFTPNGEVELWANFELPEPPPGVRAALADLRFASEAHMDGKASLAYQGWPQADGQHDAGFPLPLEELHGAAVFAHDPKAKRPNLLGLVDLAGNSICGAIHAQGLVHSHAIDDPQLLPGHGSSEFELHFQADKLAHNLPFEVALEGLGKAVPSESTWRPYRPQGGTVTIEHLRLVRKVDMPFAACDLALGLDGTTLDWRELPLPLSDVHGGLVFRSDGKGESGLSAHFDAQPPSKGAALALQLRYQTDPAEARGPAGKDLDQISCVEAHVGNLSLTGDEKQALVKRYPDVKTALERMAPKGFADLDLQRVQSDARAPARWRAELSPRDVLLQPQNFKVNTSKVRGRVIVTVEEPRDPALPSKVDNALAPLFGVAPGIGQMAFAGRLPGEHVDLWAAGIHLDDKNVRGALGEGANSFDMSGFGVLGAVDLAGRIQLAPAQPDGVGLEAQLFLRGNTFRTEPHALVLKDLRGRLELDGRGVRGPELHAVLGRTEVVLRNVAFRTLAGRFELGLELESHGLPLDKEHLSGFIDEKTLAPLIDELHLQGRLDLDHGRIDIQGQSARDSQLVFQGDVSLEDTSLQLGLPWVIRSAKASIERLLLEGGRLRAVAQVRALEGTLAGRELSHGNMLLTYVEPQLSIEDLEAELEGGKLFSLGAGAQRSGTAFSIGLEKPYVFQLALNLVGVDIGRLLRGMFDSEFAAKGSLDAQLRLRGNTENVLDIDGSGAVDVSKSRLWSIPVFRELLSQIGLNDAAVFDRMFANMHVQGGRLDLSDIAVGSSLVKLRGEHGWIDGAGDMHFDLELRYESVDKLGPLARLLYWIQNRLLSVSIRGDMARPSVVMKNPFSTLFGGGKHSRALPLPPYAPLPARF